MDIHRAKEIIKSLGYIDVSYEGKSVWIEDVDKEEKTAQVKQIDNNISIEVPLAQLRESKTNNRQ